MEHLTLNNEASAAGNRPPGRRILVLGCPGSGKSTLALKLRDRTGLPLFHLDNIWWTPERTHISREEFDRRLGEILSLEDWIIDGDYSRTYEPRLAACDSVIFLDHSEEQCLEGIAARVGTARPDLPWTEQAPDPELVAEVKRYAAENRPRLYELFRKYPDKQLLIFSSRSRAEEWLERVFPDQKEKRNEKA